MLLVKSRREFVGEASVAHVLVRAGRQSCRRLSVSGCPEGSIETSLSLDAAGQGPARSLRLEFLHLCEKRCDLWTPSGGGTGGFACPFPGHGIPPPWSSAGW